MRIRMLTPVISIAACLLAAAEPILSSGFEAGEVLPGPHGSHVWGGEADFQFLDTAHGGARSAMIASENGTDSAWWFKAGVTKNTLYRLSAYVKTDDVRPLGGRGALLNVHGRGGSASNIVTGTQDWQVLDTYFNSGEAEEVQVNCLLGGYGLASGAAFFDDIELTPISPDSLQPALNVDAATMAHPVSPYIYGQFIEHLGRCIYGGIWAEMLEDRKFFLAPAAEGSPWQIVGDPAGLSMVTEAVYVGAHMPRMTLPGGAPTGLRQVGLGLVKDAVYDGRVVIAGAPEAGPIEVRLIWGEAAEARATAQFEAITPEFQTFTFQLTSGGRTDDGIVEIVALGAGHADFGPASLMPADNVAGMRADTLALLKELNAPIYRWPGGNFVSGYDWRDGIGPRDRRPPRKNPAWQGIEHNDFGVDEFIKFCREINTEPLIVVNSGLGDVAMALEELQYTNGAADSAMGTARAANGNPVPYNVLWWGIGNEMYGHWQLGHMPLADYVQKHIAFVTAMRQADPNVKLVAVGASGTWSEAMLANAADHMDLLSEHFYCGESPDLITHVRAIRAQIQAKVSTHRYYHRTLPSLENKPVRIAMDEWNYWYGDHVYGELGTRYYLKDALGIAAGLHEFFRNSDVIEMANYAQTVNVIGCVKTTKTAAAFETTGLVLKLYRQEFGPNPVAVSGDIGPVDVMAAWTADKGALTVGVVNPLNHAYTIPLTVQGAAVSGGGKRFLVAGPDPMAYNTPGEKPAVEIQETGLEETPASLDVPPFCVVLYKLKATPE